MALKDPILFATECHPPKIADFFVFKEAKNSVNFCNIVIENKIIYKIIYRIFGDFFLLRKEDPSKY